MTGATSIRAAADAAMDAILLARLQAQQNLVLLGKLVADDHYVEPVAAFYRTGGEPNLRGDTTGDYLDHALAWLASDDTDIRTLMRTAP